MWLLLSFQIYVYGEKKIVNNAIWFEIRRRERNITRQKKIPTEKGSLEPVH